MKTATILVVDDDEVLSQVLRRVLTRQGYTVVESGTVAQALQLAQQRKPQVGLLDLRLPDGDGVDLARRLRAQGSDFPLILITASPLRLRDHPELGDAFASVLTKPLNLQELRRAIDAALARPSPDIAPSPGAPAPAAAPPPTPAPAPHAEAPAAPPPPPAHPTPAAGWRSAVMASAVVLALVAVAFVLVMPALGMPGPADWFKGAPPPTVQETPVAADLVPADDPASTTLRLAPDVAASLGLMVRDEKTGALRPNPDSVAEVRKAAEGRPLTLSGALNFDPEYVVSVVPRFGGEVTELMTVKENGQERPIRFGDRVKKGDILAVIWSKDLGEKKSDLVDALFKQWTDEETLKSYQELAKTGDVPEFNLRAARAAVASDRNASEKAEQTLRVWRVPETEIDDVRQEAKQVFDRKGVRDKAKETNWARVEVEAPITGAVVEKNRAIKGAIIDTSSDLFKLADLTRLVVWGYAYEEDLPDLRKLRNDYFPKPVPWTVIATAERRRNGADKAVSPGESGREPGQVASAGMESIGPIIDPNQHTALVIGPVDNADAKLRAGQFIEATVLLAAPEGQAEVPVSAVVEEGGPTGSVVFVQPEADQPVYQMRRVKVARRLQDVILVRSLPDEADRKLGLQELHAGEHVVTHGALVLKGALEDAQEKARERAKEK
jgi:cobalt-zinc-cadmium efflux system membrane fusion protein